MLTPTALQTKLDQFPRLKLGNWPTPLEALPSIGAELGRPVYIKRDDQVGPGLGGNKTRKLEYLLADAQRKGARKVVTYGGLQSNHARLTAAAAFRLDMEPHLLYFNPRPSRLSGNLLLNHLMGAHLHFIPMGSSNGMTIEQNIRLVHLVAWALVGPHYFIPVGGHNALGGLGYVQAVLELDEQARQAGLEGARVVVAAGSGGTLSGLLAGQALLGSSLQLTGIDVGRLWKGFSASIAHLSVQICALMGAAYRFPVECVPLIEDTFVGQAYGIPSAQGVEAIRHLARKEGILLDPVYTGKAFGGMLDLARRGQLGQNEPLIFLHTGGAPALFASDPH